MSELLEAALNYARRGFAVFPVRYVDDKGACSCGERPECKNIGKHPATKNGVYDATTDEAEIVAWWIKTPRANIGSPIGPKYHKIAVDVESIEGHGVDGFTGLLQLKDAGRNVPDSFTWKSGSGGTGVLLNIPESLEDAKTVDVAEGVSIRASDGHYVILPPSNHVKGDYKLVNDCDLAPAPLWMIEAITETRKVGSRAAPLPETVTEGGRHGAIVSLVGSLINRRVSEAAAREAALSFNKHHCSPPKDEGHVIETVADLYGRYELGTSPNNGAPSVASGETIAEENNAPQGKAQNRKGWVEVDFSLAVITINGIPKKLHVPPIPPFDVETGPTTINALLDTFKRHLYIEEDYSITGPMCGAIANFIEQDPFILGIIGPSGSIKTEIIRAFGETQNKYCYPISSLTEHTLVSGLEKNLDTIPLLRGRLLTIKDLTVLLSKKEDIRSAVFADFRDVSDGFVQREFGSGIKKEYRDIHSSILFAATPAIERYYSMYANLGTRMIFMRPQNDPIQARLQSRKNQKAGIKPIRAELQNAMLYFLDTCVNRLRTDGLPQISDAIEEEIGLMCDFLAWARHPVHHDFKGEIDERPDPEFPTRLMNVIALLTQVHAFVYERDKVGADDLEFAKRIMADNIPSDRAALLMCISDEWLSTAKLSESLGKSTRATGMHLDELFSLTIVEKKSQETLKAENNGLDKRSNHYRISPEWQATVEKYNGVIRVGGRNKRKIIGDNDNPIPYPPNHTVVFSSEDVDDNGDTTASVSPCQETQISHTCTNDSTTIGRADWARRFGTALNVFKICDKHKGLTRDEIVEAVCIEVATEHCVHADDVRQAWIDVCNDSTVEWNLQNMEKETNFR